MKTIITTVLIVLLMKGIGAAAQTHSINLIAQASAKVAIGFSLAAVLLFIIITIYLTFKTERE